MSTINLTSDITVELVDHMGDDLSIAGAARVSTLGHQTHGEGEIAGLINFLMRERHGSPFEHNALTFKVRAPIFVWREHHRHRHMSYNEQSGRYMELSPDFYVPDAQRPLVQVGKTGAYRFEPGTEEQHQLVVESTRRACQTAWDSYQEMLSAGVAKEVARIPLPVTIFSTCFVTCNVRSLTHFLSLRTKDESSRFPSYPQHEIEVVARQYETHLAEHFPLTYAAFVKNGRVAP